MEFNFTIKNDKLTSTAYPKGVTGNVNTYTCRFNIECDIAGLIWFCIFKQGDNVYNQIIEDNTCVMPYEVLTSAEPLYIGCYGTNGDDDIKRVSTNFICFDVKQGAYSEADAPETPTPDIWESLINKNIPYIGDNGNWFIYDVEQKTYVDSGNKSQGEKGEQGIQGEKGDKGEDGYTPIRGVDYWTEADQNQISTDLDEKIANKVDKVAGKGLSTNDYTDDDKAAVSGLNYALSSDNKSLYAINGYIEASEAQFGKLQVQGTDILATLENKANETELKRLEYYGDITIIPSNASYFTVNNTGETITGLTDTGKTQTELVIPYEINGVKITKLENSGTSILAGNSVITKVILPNSIVTIGNNAFSGCTSLSSINIPSSVTHIGAYIFSYCSSLKSIDIPNGVTHIYYRAFIDCTALKSIAIPNSVTSIDESAFNGCTNLIIYCEQGSYAETFAKSKNIPIMYTDVDLSNYVEKDGDKVLSTNDYTDTDKAEVAKVKDKVGFTDYAKETGQAGIVSIGTEVTPFGVGPKGVLKLAVVGTNEIDKRNNLHTFDEFPLGLGNLDYAVRSVRPTTSNSIPDTLAVNIIYGLGIESTLTINLPSIESPIATGDFIQVDFYSGKTPTNLTVTFTGGSLSDIDLIPEANTMYSLYFDWGLVYCHTTEAGAVLQEPGWRFSYAEYPHKEV